MDGGENRCATAAPAVDAAVRQVVDDVESYLVGWMARLQRVLEQSCGAAEREAQLVERTAAFDQQYQQWQAQRQHEMQQIQQGAEQLTEAWQRLESEQRQWLSRREASSSPTPAPLPSACVVPQSAERKRDLPGSVHGPVPSAVEAGQPLEGMSREFAVQQFEQLRREVGQFSRSDR